MYDKDGSKAHEMYEKTGFIIKEYDVYNQNNILGTVRNKVPGYSDEELRRNEYSLQYKPYSLWTVECQNTYTTFDAAEVGF